MKGLPATRTRHLGLPRRKRPAGDGVTVAVVLVLSIPNRPRSRVLVGPPGDPVSMLGRAGYSIVHYPSPLTAMSRKRKRARGRSSATATRDLELSDPRRSDGAKVPTPRARKPFLRGFLTGAGSLALVALVLPSKIVSFSENFGAAKNHLYDWLYDRPKYQGRWTSDEAAWVGKNLIGTDEPIPDTGDVQFYLEQGPDGSFFGEVHTRWLAESPYPWSRLMVDGTVGFRGLKGQVWDIIGNERRVLTTFRLQLTGEDTETLRLIPRDGRIFPGSLILWRTNYEMDPGQQGARFEPMVLRALRELEDAASNDGEQSKE